MDRYEVLAILIITVAAVPIVAVFGIIAAAAFRERRGKSPLRKLSDPVFGNLEHDGDLWVAIPFDPKNGFMVIVVADESGPSIRQQRFFERIIANLTQHEGEAKSFIGPQNNELDLNSLTIYALEIGTEEELEKGEFVLELSDKDAYEIHRIEFKELVPSQYGIDD